MKKIYVACLALTIIASCKKDTITTYDCTGVAPTYTVDIKPILDANCATSSFHSASAKKDGYDLSSYSGSKSASGKSAFLGSIQHKSGFKAMPDGRAALDEADVKLISCWVQNGAPQ